MIHTKINVICRTQMVRHMTDWGLGDSLYNAKSIYSIFVLLYTNYIYQIHAHAFNHSIGSR